MAREMSPGWRSVFVWLVLVLCAAFSSPAFAQDQTESSSLGSLARRVFFDPTTYAPAILTYDATMRDWKSSQPLFQSGLFVEHNPRFTISGRPDDAPVDYATGKRQILKDSLTVLEFSIANNAANGLIERALIDRHPEHRKLFRVIGTIERIAFASTLAYFEAAPHYRQWQRNDEMATQVGVLVSVPIN